MASVSARVWQKNRLFFPVAFSAAAAFAMSTVEPGSATVILLLRGSLGGCTTTPSRFDEPFSHSRIAAGVSDGRRQPHALHIAPPIAASRSMTESRCAPRSVPGQRVDLVDDHVPQLLEQLRHRHARRDEHHLERLGGRHQQLGGFLHELPLLAVGRVAVPDETSEPDHLGVRPEALLLVVEQGLDGRDVQGARRCSPGAPSARR
jgi:hypothetical protein